MHVHSTIIILPWKHMSHLFYSETHARIHLGKFPRGGGGAKTRRKTFGGGGGGGGGVYSEHYSILKGLSGHQVSKGGGGDVHPPPPPK